jgi:hypothetical protein
LVKYFVSLLNFDQKFVKQASLKPVTHSGNDYAQFNPSEIEINTNSGNWGKAGTAPYTR